MQSAKSVSAGFRGLSKEERRESLLALAVLGALLVGQFALVVWLFLRHG